MRAVIDDGRVASSVRPSSLVLIAFFTVAALACAGKASPTANPALAGDRAEAAKGAAGLSNPDLALDRLALDPMSRAHAAIYDAAIMRASPAGYPPDLAGSVRRAIEIMSPEQLDAGPPRQVGNAAVERAEIARAISSAARATGVSESYLWRTAERESGLVTSAASATSTARGLYQFVEQTWLAALWRHGHELGLTVDGKVERDPLTNRFVVSPSGRGLLHLRHDPWFAARMAGELANDNRRALRRALGRPVHDGELYAAHFLGAAGAASLYRAAQRTPQTAASVLLPDAAAANPAVFFSHGRPLTVAQLVRWLHHG